MNGVFNMRQLEKLYEAFLRIGQVSTDSRRNVKDTIFFALSGDHFNGNQFAQKAIDHGAQLAVVDQKSFVRDARYFLVDDSMVALQDLARIHRSNLKARVIGITGTNGKTTTKELVSAVLLKEKNIAFTKGNFNNHIGVPLTILSMTPETEIAVVEMGANHIGEIKLLCSIAGPDYGLITNIGKAHLEGFGSLEGVIKAKTEIYEFLKEKDGTAFVNHEDPLLMRLSEGIDRITYGLKSGLFSSDIERTKPFISLKWEYKGQTYHCPTRLIGGYNQQNIHAAIAVGLHFNIPPEKINEAIIAYNPNNNRSQMVKTATNLVVMDAYNANPVSMANAIENFREYPPANSWLILGDMFELGKESRKEHLEIIRILQQSHFKNILLVGKDFHSLCNEHSFISFANTSEAEKYLVENPIRHANVLIKGSRGMQLEKILRYL